MNEKLAPMPPPLFPSRRTLVVLFVLVVVLLLIVLLIFSLEPEMPQRFQSQNKPLYQKGDTLLPSPSPAAITDEELQEMKKQLPPRNLPKKPPL